MRSSRSWSTTARSGSSSPPTRVFIRSAPSFVPPRADQERAPGLGALGRAAEAGASRLQLHWNAGHFASIDPVSVIHATEISRWSATNRQPRLALKPLRDLIRVNARPAASTRVTGADMTLDDCTNYIIFKL